MTFDSGALASSAALKSIAATLLADFTDEDESGTGGTITGTTYGTPTAACQVTLTSTGTFAIVWFDALVVPGTSGQNARGSVAVSGDTTQSALTTEANQSFINNSSTSSIKSASCARIAINPGTNVYTLQYRNTTTGGTATATSQHMLVFAP